MLPSLTFFPRDDVAGGYNVARDLVEGFLATWRNRPRGDMQVRLDAGAGQPCDRTAGSGAERTGRPRATPDGRISAA